MRPSSFTCSHVLTKLSLTNAAMMLLNFYACACSVVDAYRRLYLVTESGTPVSKQNAQMRLQQSLFVALQLVGYVANACHTSVCHRHDFQALNTLIGHLCRSCDSIYLSVLAVSP